MKFSHPKKYDKSEVGFESPAKGPNHCSMCEHYQGGKCEIVRGEVKPGDWCNKFKKKEA